MHFTIIDETFLPLSPSGQTEAHLCNLQHWYRKSVQPTFQILNGRFKMDKKLFKSPCLLVVPQFAGVGEWYKQVLCCACEENSGVGVNIPALDFSFFLGRKK